MRSVVSAQHRSNRLFEEGCILNTVIQVLLVDDHALVRSGLVTFLRMLKEFTLAVRRVMDSKL